MTTTKTDNKMLKRGDITTIYEDPYTQQKPEGKAKILKLVGNDWYKVKFISDNVICERKIL